MTASDARPPPAPAPVVVTASGGIILGKTHGVTEWHPRAVDAFYGIPYARVPVRFQAAVAGQTADVCERGRREQGGGEGLGFEYLSTFACGW
ncbi:hypothetical protein PWT90_09126 [Aphanocladium album]|nr:hypothetical protein PWT90_09126 [Aphanocladium album]